jgi:hypothetical protein
MTGRPRCARCGHVEHVRACRAKGPSRCVPFSSAAATGMMCGLRPSCPCAWRTCACGKPVALACELSAEARTLPLLGTVMIVSVERGSARAADGLLAVRELDDGFLACRTLADGEQPLDGQWRGREHTGDCGLLAKCEADERWLILRS